MNGLVQRPYRTVTERLGDRLDAVDSAIGQLLGNEAKLIADSVMTTQRCEMLDSVVQEHHATIKAERQSLSVLTQQVKMLEAHYIDFRKHNVTFWQRLRWLLRGGV